MKGIKVVYIGSPEHSKSKNRKHARYHAQKNLGSKERISNVKEQQDPYYACVVCNRTLYKRSALHFNIEKYCLDRIDYYTNVKRFDGNMYICQTCNKKLSKSDIPAQAVCNKLEVFDFPNGLVNLNRLERTIISRRILFKKIAVMPKGQTPKLKGAICNVPIDTKNITNVLPQGANSNGIVMIKLKRKLMFRGHVYFEAVSPEAVRIALQYLKLNNPLYSDIEIDID